jgi:serine/threonine protein phosphatase PrpC
MIAAVSDGHGHAKSFRSGIGAEFAVRAAVRVCTEFVGRLGSQDLSTIKRYSEDDLPKGVVNSWNEAVADDLSTRPFLVEELAQLELKQGIRSRREVALTPVIAYGATVLVVLVASSFHLFLQLGDGEILTVSDDGEVSRPVKPDERLFANETTSLSSRDAWRDFRVSLQAISGRPPALVLLCTDGYVNSFSNDAGFLKVGPDLLAMIRSEGIGSVEAQLQSWLSEASREGSGDDITVGILCRNDALKPDDRPMAHPGKSGPEGVTPAVHGEH